MKRSVETEGQVRAVMMFFVYVAFIAGLLVGMWLTERKYDEQGNDHGAADGEAATHHQEAAE